MSGSAAAIYLAPEPDRRRLRPVHESREREIAALRSQGLTLAEIGRRYELTRQRVAQIIDESSHGRVPRAEVVRARRRAEAQQARDRSGRILELWREGYAVGEIHERVGVTWKAVKGTVARLATDEDREARAEALSAKVSCPSPRFLGRELLDGLRLVANELGHPPSGPEYERVARELQLACRATVYMRFDGWNRALQAAGLREPVVDRRPRDREWNAAACWRALRSVSHRLGDPPRYRRYLALAAGRDDLPSASTVRQRLGPWRSIAAALAARERTVDFPGEAAA